MHSIINGADGIPKDRVHVNGNMIRRTNRLRVRSKHEGWGLEKSIQKEMI